MARKVECARPSVAPLRIRLLSSHSALSSRTDPLAASPSSPALAVEGLACQRGERLLFEGLGFALGPGQLLLLTGANGSGKSSLLRLLAGLNLPAAGVIRWRGRTIAEDAPAHRQRLRFLAHLDGVKPALTVSENLTFWAALLGAQAMRVDAALATFGLAPIADLPARFLSAGQRRRLALSRLALMPAPLWLLDEPSTSLDSEGVERLLATLAAHRAQGGIAVIATHDRLALEPSAEIRLSTDGSSR
jgi:heme exporter protein A